MASFGVNYKAYIPQFKNVLFENVSVNAANEAGKGGKYALQLNGFDVSSIASSCTVEPCTPDCYISDFTIRNSSFVGSEQNLQMTNVDGLTMENVSMIPGSTAADSLSKCKNLTFKNCDFTGSKTQRSVFAATEGVTDRFCI